MSLNGNPYKPILFYSFRYFKKDAPCHYPFSFSSVAQSCPTLRNPMNCSTAGLPVHHQLPEFTQTHIHWVSDAIQPSHPLSSPSPPALNLSQHQGLFKWDALRLHKKAFQLHMELGGRIEGTLESEGWAWFWITYPWQWVPELLFSASICFSMLGFQIRFHWPLWKLSHSFLKKKRRRWKERNKTKKPWELLL